jgi:hypothetical protein
MRFSYRSALAAAAILFVSFSGPSSAAQDDASRAVTDGGIFVPGWQGRVDAGEAEKGLTLDNAKLSAQGDAMHFVTGPAVTYWNPANKASGNYTVKAKFTEPKYMNLNNHSHPYGVVIAGNDMGTDQQTLLYCSAYGNGTFIVRGFGPAPFRVSDSRPTPNPAVNKASGSNEPVTQEVALSVKDDKVECAINGTVVASYNKADVVGAGKLKSTDGVYGIRVGHNTEGTVTGLTMTNP